MPCAWQLPQTRVFWKVGHGLTLFSFYSSAQNRQSRDWFAKLNWGYWPCPPPKSEGPSSLPSVVPTWWLTLGTQVPAPAGQADPAHIHCGATSPWSAGSCSQHSYIVGLSHALVGGKEARSGSGSRGHGSWVFPRQQIQSGSSIRCLIKRVTTPNQLLTAISPYQCAFCSPRAWPKSSFRH